MAGTKKTTHPAQRSPGNGKERFLGLFMECPVSLWEEDIAGLTAYLDGLRLSGVTDIRAYLAGHPDEVVKGTGLVKIVAVNKATLELYEAPDEKSLLSGLSSVFTEESLSAFHDIVVALFEGRKQFETEGVNRSLRGKRLHVNLKWSLLLDSKGNLTRALVSVVDITDRKRAEEALKESERRFRGAFENASLGASMVDLTGRFIKVNRFLCAMLGYSEGELLSKTFSDITHPDDVWIGLEHLKRQIAGEMDFAAFEKRYLRKDGSVLYLIISPALIRGSRGEPQYFISLFQDITERKRMEMEIGLRSEILSQMAEGVNLVRGSDNTLIFTNPAFDRMFGYGPGELIGKHISIVNAPTEKDPLETANGIKKTLAAEGRWHGELQNVKKDGSTFWCAATISAFDHRELGQVYISVHTDITERKCAEEALRESERRTRSIIESIPVGMHMYRLEPDGRLIFIGANPAADRILGVDNSVFIGKTIEEAFPPLKETEVPQRYREVAVSGKTWHTESIDYQEGAIQGAFEVYAFQTAPNAMVAAFEDITERKQAERALKQSETKYRRLYNETPVLLHSIDRNGVVVEVNDYWLKTLGYERNEVIGRKVTDFLTDASRTHSQDVVQPAFFRDGIVKQVSFQFVKKNGDVVDALLSATAERDAAGNVVRSLAVIEDITERKRAEEALRQSEERFKAITMTASDAILLMDDRGKLVHWNPAAERMFGYSAEEALGKDLHLFLAPQRLHENYLRGFANFIKTGQGPVINKSVELVAIKKDGTEFPIEVSASAMNVGGRWHAVGIVRDITERKQLEQELLKSEKLESIGTLAGGIAHDFNNLLQGVFGYLSLAKLTVDNRAKCTAALEQAEKALHQSVNLASQLLTFSKGGKPAKKVVSLQPVIENAVKFALSGSRVSSELALADDLRPVDADEGQIGQVIQNIVLNADQAMPLGGKISISARNVPAASAVGRPPDLQGDLVETTIRDEGTGIPPEHLSRIFDPYFTTKEKGSGLGLATSYSIIRNHGGVISVASELGKGTTFFVYLPASALAPSEPAAPPVAGQVRHTRVLVMDDDDVVRAVGGELLRELGHEVDFAERGETAIEKYRSARDAGRPFDVVILDLTVRGGMGGVEAVRRLKEIDPDVKAIVSSGYSDDAVVAEYQNTGFRSFLKKPYTIEQLRDTLNGLLT